MSKIQATNNISDGTPVWHKTGGPRMILKAHGHGMVGNMVACSWFDKDGKYQTEEFYEHELVTTDPTPSGAMPIFKTNS